ncbi:MAG TPA: phosphate ABC transporter substrate-binding protein PstS [Aggregatilineaceae bacterium]|nr:phosphate ABC transporter substrate-binding protein PstS [Aggregatilineaceae bacterium]
MQHKRILWVRLVSLAVILAVVVPVAFAQGEIPGSGLITGPADGEAKTLNGAGATFPKPLYDQWIAAYNTLTGVQINYQAIGSGGGIQGISDQSVDFGASDGAMTDDQLAQAKGGPILHIPMALGGVVPTYNLTELQGQDVLKFTPETLALVFLGEAGRITGDNPRDPLIKWNDSRLVADNPQLANIDKYIVVVHRSDSSGTTNIWTSYLSAVSTDWADLVGFGNAVDWPTGIGARGNPGVAGNVAQTPYSIGYVEQGYAVANNLPAAAVQNKSGNFVTASQETVSAAAAGVDLPDDMRVKIVNADGANAYPISGFTWLLVYENQTDAAKALALTRYVWWATHDGQMFIATSEDPVVQGYSPLPEPAIKKAETLIMKINVNGQQVLPQDIANAVKQ